MVDKRKRIVVCAAIKINGAILAGARHYDSVMCDQLSAMNKGAFYGEKQGFIDQYGVFMNRKEALKVAKESGQPLDMKRNGGNGEDLYSEGLY